MKGVSKYPRTIPCSRCGHAYIQKEAGRTRHPVYVCAENKLTETICDAPAVAVAFCEPMGEPVDDVPEQAPSIAFADSADKPRKHLIIPDCQVKPGVNTDHLDWIGRYIVEKRPDVVVCIGDFADMESLSHYDKGKKCYEGRRYRADIDAAIAGMKRLMAPLHALQAQQAYYMEPMYAPRLVMTLGNHEDRIRRAVEEDPKLDGTISVDDLKYVDFGWDVIPFLEPVKIDGVSYAHYFTTGVMGRPVSSAAALLRECMGSAVMGHVQTTDMAIHKKSQHTAIFCGIAYTHLETYLGAQGNNTRRQIVMLHEVRDGLFDPMFVSLAYLKRAYGEAAA